MYTHVGSVQTRDTGSHLVSDETCSTNSDDEAFILEGRYLRDLFESLKSSNFQPTHRDPETQRSRSLNISSTPRTSSWSGSLLPTTNSIASSETPSPNPSQQLRALWTHEDDDQYYSTDDCDASVKPGSTARSIPRHDSADVPSNSFMLSRDEEQEAEGERRRWLYDKALRLDTKEQWLNTKERKLETRERWLNAKEQRLDVLS